MSTFNSTITGTGDSLFGTEANQLVQGTDSGQLMGTKFNNSCVFGSGGADTISAESPVDSLSGVGIGSTYTGNTGNDSFDFGTYGLTSVSVAAGADNDTVSIKGIATATNIRTGAGSDLVQVDAALLNSLIETGADADFVRLRDSVSGGTFRFGSGADTLAVSGTVISTLIEGKADNDSFIFNDSVVSSTILGNDAAESTGDGSDSIIALRGVISSPLIAPATYRLSLPNWPPTLPPVIAASDK